MENHTTPTDRELEILKILWEHGEATVRQVYEEMRDSAEIVQNTVQAFLRNMEEKGLVEHRVEGRSFVYRPRWQRQQTTQHLVGRLLDRLYDGAIDQLVASLLTARWPSEAELARLERLVHEAKAGKKPPRAEAEP